MKTSTLLPVLPLLATLNLGCVTEALWKMRYREVTNESLAVAVEGVYARPAARPDGPAGIAVHGRPADPAEARDAGWTLLGDRGGYLEIEAPSDEVTALTVGLEEVLRRNCYSIASLEGFVRFDESGGAVLTLLLLLDIGTGSPELEAFSLRGSWSVVVPSHDTGHRLVLETRPWPSRFWLVREHVWTNDWVLTVLTPFTVGLDAAIIGTCVAVSLMPGGC